MPVSRKRKKKKPHRHNRPAQTNSSNSYAMKRLENKLMDISHLKDYKIEKFKDSVSSLILDFGRDFIENCESKEDYLRIVPFVIICWNLGSMENEEQLEEAIQKITKELGADFEDYCRMLVDRKKIVYDEYKYFVVEYDISFPNDNLYLSVMSAKGK